MGVLSVAGGTFVCSKIGLKLLTHLRQFIYFVVVVAIFYA
jgi:hypothetical protein